MSYENAPATEMLATYCAACGRPLVDSVSVEVGLGPECRKRHGWNADVDEETRGEANRIVHRIAVEQTGAAVLEGVAKLRELGFAKLADRVVKRVKPIVIEETDDGRLAVKAPYRGEAVEGWRRVPGRRFDKESKRNVIPVSSKRALWELLKAHYAGEYGIGPKGAFEVPAAA
jgi:hypothetical protein